MKIFTFHKKNRSVVFAALLMVSIVIMILIANIESMLQSKVNHSNAMQVATMSVAEPLIPASSPDFFIEYRLERDKIRSERSDLLRESIKNAKTDDSRNQAQDSVLKMIAEKQKEAEMESLIKSRGFADALVFIRENSVSAVIKTTSLSHEEVIQIADVITRTSGVKAENISISAKP
ncbi:SpoIIIAH-like family protein [Pelosinus propionicus]|uniref:Stage III sporulation protein AH n=1 Tax=Pelosinus propionicus DSM 13327 TaxID=1123291 RepID=A0A1I4KRR3_9FIRM|nr:SpoIIIAH-like family protein [Pelosinus propionicus]SFL81311.1 stage III sporulation protein AH [Pelosinus propionicus DSM 13327]